MTIVMRTYIGSMNLNDLSALSRPVANYVTNDMRTGVHYNRVPLPVQGLLSNIMDVGLIVQIRKES